MRNPSVPLLFAVPQLPLEANRWADESAAAGGWTPTPGSQVACDALPVFTDRPTRIFSRWLVTAFLFALLYALILVLALFSPDFEYPDMVLVPLLLPAFGFPLICLGGIGMAIGGLIEARALPDDHRGEWMGWFSLTVFVAYPVIAMAGLLPL